MPNLEAELSGFKDSHYFSLVGFCVGYWQGPLPPGSYDACRIIAPQGSLVSTRVLHGLEIPMHTSIQQFYLSSAAWDMLLRRESMTLLHMQLM